MNGHDIGHSIIRYGVFRRRRRRRRGPARGEDREDRGPVLIALEIQHRQTDLVVSGFNEFVCLSLSMKRNRIRLSVHSVFGGKN